MRQITYTVMQTEGNWELSVTRTYISGSCAGGMLQIDCSRNELVRGTVALGDLELGSSASPTNSWLTGTWAATRVGHSNLEAL
jgi:hypothetical protein